MPTSGDCRLRSTSTARALIGDMYKTRQRRILSGAGENISRFNAQRNAARVLPVPVGARIRVDSPRAIAGHPRVCGEVGCTKTSSNQARTGALNSAREFVDTEKDLSFCLRALIFGNV